MPRLRLRASVNSSDTNLSANLRGHCVKYEHMLSALPWWSQPVDATLYLKGEMECALMGTALSKIADVHGAVTGSLEKNFVRVSSSGRPRNIARAPE